MNATDSKPAIGIRRVELRLLITIQIPSSLRQVRHRRRMHGRGYGGPAAFPAYASCGDPAKSRR